MIYILSFFSFLFGIIIINSPEWTIRGLNINFSDNYFNIVLGVPLIVFSLYIVFVKVKYINKKQIEFSKCPKCKESYAYGELTNGKCKKCKNIDTIDIEEYYKNNTKSLHPRE